MLIFRRVLLAVKGALVAGAVLRDLLARRHPPVALEGDGAHARCFSSPFGWAGELTRPSPTPGKLGSRYRSHRQRWLWTLTLGKQATPTNRPERAGCANVLCSQSWHRELAGPTPGVEVGQERGPPAEAGRPQGRRSKGERGGVSVANGLHLYAPSLLLHGLWRQQKQQDEQHKMVQRVLL